VYGNKMEKGHKSAIRKLPVKKTGLSIQEAVNR
jgi:hypothetical protein